MNQISPITFFGWLKWLDGRPLLDHVEPYRRQTFTDALYTFDGDRPRYNLVLAGRAKKNWKTADLVLSALYKLAAWQSDKGNQCYVLANDLDQANDDLSLCKKLVEARDPRKAWLRPLNPALADTLIIKQKVIERRDGRGFLEILPAGDVVGSHGKTYLFCGFDEIHGYKTWDIIEAMQLDPTRTDAMMWITSYASIYHRPGVPLFDLFARGKNGKDRRMLFSWYAADYCTDPAYADLDPESKANPSRGSWEDQGYLEQQKSRLPAHKYRRLHLNLPGLPEGSAFSFEKIDAAIERGVRVRPPQAGISYSGFVDMSGGSNDDAALAVSHKDTDGRSMLDLVINQGRSIPFDPMMSVNLFVKQLKGYRCSHVVGDRFAGETFRAAFEKLGVSYTVSDLTKSQLYEALEPKLNSGQVAPLDNETMESQFLGLVWRANKIDHPANEHDDWSNAVAGAIHLVSGAAIDVSGIQLIGSHRVFGRGEWGGVTDYDTGSAVERAWDSGALSGRRFWDD